MCFKFSLNHIHFTILNQMTHRLFKSNPAEARWAYRIGHSVVCTPWSYLVGEINPPIIFSWLDRISILRGGDLFPGGL